MKRSRPAHRSRLAPRPIAAPGAPLATAWRDWSRATRFLLAQCTGGIRSARIEMTACAGRRWVVR